MMAEKIRVLYVDDEQGLLELGKLYLERSGELTVTITPHTHEAIRILEHERFDVIISDYQMQEMDGIEFLKYLKKKGNTTPFIIFTGKGREDVVIEALNAGADFYLQKGGEPKSQFAELLHKIKKAVEARMAEIALCDSEERFRIIFTHAAEGILIANVSTRKFLHANSAICTMLGYSEKELTNLELKDIHPEKDLARLEDMFGAMARGEMDLAENIPVLRKDGVLRYVDIRATTVLIDGYRCNLGMFTDITGRKKSDEELRIAHEKYTKAFLSVPDAITITGQDSGQITEVNDAALEIFGYTRDELIGKTTLELGIWRNKEERDRFTDQVRKYGKITHFEALNWRKSGEMFDALVNADTITIENKPCIIAIIRDDTGRRKTENALRESEERYNSLFNNSYSVSLLIDPDTGNILDANAAATWFYGYTHDMLISMGIYDLNRLSREKVIRDLQRAKNEKAKHFLSTHFLASGEKRDVEIYSGPITLNGKPHFYSIIHDISKRKEAEEALRQKEAELHDILEGSPIPMFVIDSNHRLISWNKALEDATASKATDMIGTTHQWQAFYPMERPCLADLLVDGETDVILELYTGKIDAARLAGGVCDGTDFFPNLGKSGKWLHFSACVIRDDGGNIVGAVETLQDITSAKRAEEDIRALSQFQQSVIDNANVWISVLDPKGKILVWNNTAEQISGYLAKDVIGTNTVWKQLYPDPLYRKQVLRNILDIIQTNTYVENFETRVLTNSGDQKIIWWNTQPLRDAQGKPVQFIAIGRDNTERRLTEERINSLRQFQESVIKNASIWISVLDGKGNVRVWNRAAEEISGYPAAELIGSNTIWSRMYPGKEYRRTVTTTIHDVIRSKKYLENFETMIRTKGGLARIISWNISPLQDVPGIEETFIAIGKDITEQKSLQDSVQLANKKLNLLSSITRHDIVNQLTALDGYLDLSREVLGDPVKLKEYIIEEQKIAEIIEAQILFTKDYQEMGVKMPEWQNVHRCVDLAKANLALSGIVVKTDGLSLEVFADLLLVRVFYNMIDNALRYGGEKMTTIRVSSLESDHGLIIILEDDGIGIPADQKEAVFNRGYFKHMGFGLFLSREILAITGITIAENGVPGKGARFEITVPKGGYRYI